MPKESEIDVLHDACGRTDSVGRTFLVLDENGQMIPSILSAPQRFAWMDKQLGLTV